MFKKKYSKKSLETSKELRKSLVPVLPRNVAVLSIKLI